MKLWVENSADSNYFSYGSKAITSNPRVANWCFRIWRTHVKRIISDAMH